MNDKDLLLQLLTKGKPESYFTAKGINEYLFKNLNIDQVDNIISEIRKEKPELIKDFVPLNRVVGIQGTGMIESFLKTGGFTKIEKELKEFSNLKKEKDVIEFEKSKIDLELAKKMLEEFPKTKWFARIGFIIAIVLMLKELYILIWK